MGDDDDAHAMEGPEKGGRGRLGRERKLRTKSHSENEADAGIRGYDFTVMHSEDGKVPGFLCGSVRW